MLNFKLGMKLFCFPYAGGSSAIFNQWKNYLTPDIEIRAIELAGRGKRIHETHYSDFNEVIEDVFPIIADEIKSNENYALFGHSMGAKIAHKLTLKIIEHGLSKPKHIFLSGRGAPDVKGNNEIEYYKLPEKDFIEEVFKLGGTSKEFFEHPELLELFLPLLRNDFKMATKEITNSEIVQLPCDISIFIGKEEDLIPEQIYGWKNYTSKSCIIHYFNGGHFFINEQIEPIVKTINKIIQ